MNEISMRVGKIQIIKKRKSFSRSEGFTPLVLIRSWETAPPKTMCSDLPNYSGSCYFFMSQNVVIELPPTLRKVIPDLG